jgi:hypothetical protein
MGVGGGGKGGAFEGPRQRRACYGSRRQLELGGGLLCSRQYGSKQICPLRPPGHRCAKQQAVGAWESSASAARSTSSG